jgi:hypothetical protein
MTPLRAIFANSLDYWSQSQWALDAKQAITRKLHGLIIIIENPQYSLREGKGWMSTAPADYGYVAGTLGADGDEVDCYIGPHPDSDKVYIVDQNRMDGSGEFDEHKIMFGYRNIEAAKADYVAGHTDGEKIFRAITEVSLAHLKFWLKHKDHGKPYGG